MSWFKRNTPVQDIDKATSEGHPPAQTDEELARELDRQFRMEDEAAAQTAQQDQQQVAAMQHTPPQVAPPQQAVAAAAAAAAPPAPRRARIEHVPQHIRPGERVIVTPEQLVKVRADLAIVNQNTSLLQDLLRNLGPDEKVKDNELINDIAETCEQMQKRVMKLCEQVENEDLIVELFSVNDVLNDAQNMFKLRATQESALDQARENNKRTPPVPPVPPVRGAVPGQPISAARLMGQEELPAYHAPPPHHHHQDEGSFMGSSSLFSRTAPAPATTPAAAAASGGPASLLIDLGDSTDGTNTSGYMEIQPVSSSNPSGANSSDLLLGPLDPLADGNNTPGGYMTVEPPQGPLIDVGRPPETNRAPTIYGDGQIRQLSERDRRNLEQQQDSMFNL